MFLISHIMGSLLFAKMLTFFGIPFSPLIAVVFQLLPDLDIFWARKLNEHHQSYFHSPLMWLVLYMAGIFLNSVFFFPPQWVLHTFLVQTLSHLLLDHLSGRTAGIPFLYPLSTREYSLFPLDKRQGNMHPLRFDLRFLKYYMKNKVQVALEVAVIISGIVVLAYQ